MPELLRVQNLTAGYGEARIISNVTFALPIGKSLALLGRNGVGKTTFLNTLVGVTTRHTGRIFLDGDDLTELKPHARAIAGIGWVPQERDIFRSLTVEENLTSVARRGPWNASRVFDMFPRLRERRHNGGRQLSGGEQQMLAIGRALVLNPKILLLDEPTEGLAPIVVDDLLGALRQLALDGLSMIIVEQKPRKILPFTDQVIILNRGAIAYDGQSATLIENPAVLDTHLRAGI